MEQRNWQRFLLHAPVVFRWTRSASCLERGAGFARDVSTQGAFVVSSDPCPPAGTKIHIELLLDMPNTMKQMVRLKATGRVVRLANKVEGPGFAIAANFAWAGDESAAAAVAGSGN